MKILILKPSSLGDVIHALPVLRLIKQHLPTSEVYWWIEKNLAPLLADDPDLAGVIPFQRKRWTSPWRWDELARSIAGIRQQQFDWVIDLQSLFRSGAVAWLANGGFTIGLDDRREGARGFYDIAVPRRSQATHAVDWYLDVLPRLGVPVHSNFTWLPERPAVAKQIREQWPDNGCQWIALQPGARWLNKRWPVTHFAALVVELARKYPNARFAILGGADDRILGDAVAQSAPSRCVNLAGKTSLHSMIEWLRRCAVLVTNDTGPMHIASALRRPVVAIFGPTDPQRTGPYGQISRAMQHPLPCAPCLKDRCANSHQLECLESITPAAVAMQVAAVLDAVE